MLSEYLCLLNVQCFLLFMLSECLCLAIARQGALLDAGSVQYAWHRAIRCWCWMLLLSTTCHFSLIYLQSVHMPLFLICGVLFCHLLTTVNL